MSNQQSTKSNDALIPAIILFGSLTLLLLAILPQPSTNSAPAAVQPTAAVEATTVAVEPTVAAPAAVTYSRAVVNTGSGLFQATCTTCHGFDGTGIPGLGKNLIDSEFVHSLSDADLVAFIEKGRDASDPLNTTGIPMPPYGGNPTLTEDQLHAIVAYVRTLSDPSLIEGASTSGSAGQAPAPTAETVVVEPTAVPTTAAPTAEVAVILPTAIPVTQQAASGESAYAAACANCHGADGSGNQPFGPGILDSEMMTDRDQLVDLLTNGNVPETFGAGYAHQPRGGYPPLTDEQIQLLADYLLTFVTP